MLRRLARLPSRIGSLSLTLGGYMFVCGCALGQAIPSAGFANNSTVDKRNTVQVTGCIGHVSGEVRFASKAGHLFVLTGQTEGLQKYDERELTIEGKMGDPIRTERPPIDSFDVSRIVKVFDVAKPKLNDLFAHTKTWHVETIKERGFKFAHPRTMTSATESQQWVQPLFVTAEGAAMVGKFNIPGDAYTNANLTGGSFTVFVNSEVRDRASCAQFAVAYGPADSTYQVGRLNYVLLETGSLAMQMSNSDYYFHIFENGQCYEFVFELVKDNPDVNDADCNVPVLSQKDDLNLIKPLLANISFFRPTVAQEPSR